MGDENWTSGQGLGLQMWRRGERVHVGHTGSMPGYLAVLAVHRPSRTGVVAFANAYTLHGGNLGAVGRDILTEILDREPERPEPWRPGATPPPDAEALTGRWWWMGREYQASWDSVRRELVVTPLAEPGPPWRFRPDGPDRGRLPARTNDGGLVHGRRGPARAN